MRFWVRAFVFLVAGIALGLYAMCAPSLCLSQVGESLDHGRANRTESGCAPAQAALPETLQVRTDPSDIDGTSARRRLGGGRALPGALRRRLDRAEESAGLKTWKDDARRAYHQPATGEEFVSEQSAVDSPQGHRVRDCAAGGRDFGQRADSRAIPERDRVGARDLRRGSRFASLLQDASRASQP